VWRSLALGSERTGSHKPDANVLEVVSPQTSQIEIQLQTSKLAAAAIAIVNRHSMARIGAVRSRFACFTTAVGLLAALDTYNAVFSKTKSSIFCVKLLLNSFISVLTTLTLRGGTSRRQTHHLGSFALMARRGRLR